jgi:hypothetical protein
VSRPGRDERPDLRMPALGATAWAGALVGSAPGAPVPALGAGLIGAAVVLLVVVRRDAGRALLVAGALLVLVAALAVTELRAHQVAHNPPSCGSKARSSPTRSC